MRRHPFSIQSMIHNGCCRFFYDRIYVFFSSPAPPHLVESIKDNVTALSKIAALREVRAHVST